MVLATSTKPILTGVRERVRRLNVQGVTNTMVLACGATSTKRILTRVRQRVRRLNVHGCGLCHHSRAVREPISQRVQRGVGPGARLNVDSADAATVLPCHAKSTKPRWTNCAMAGAHGPPTRA